MKQSFPAVALVAALLAQAALPSLGLAQTATPNPAATPAAPGGPNLVVATVKLDGGWRASKLIGASVYDDSNHQVGNVDDLIVMGADKISVAIVSVGGFLGIGSKLIAVPYDHLHYDPAAKDAKVVMPGATKESLNQMPGFTYGNS